MPTPSLSANVYAAPAGQDVVFEPTDGSGNPLDVTSVASPDDVQTVTFPGIIQAGSFPLSLGGHTTTDIPFTVTQPSEIGTWTIPTVAGNPIKLAYTAPPYDPSPYHSTVLWEIIEGGIVTTSVQADQARINVSPDFTLPNIAGGSGDCSFKVIFPTYTPAGSSLTIRMSFPPGTFRLIADALYVEDLTTSASIVYDDAQSAHFSAVAPDTVYGAGSTGPQYSGTEHIWNFGGQQAGTTVQVNPADVLNALQALPNIGAGNVSVASAPGGVAITFTGTMAAVAQPPITTTTPGVSIAHAPGGNVPVATITPQGGSPGSPIPFNGLGGGLLTVVGGRTWVHYALPTGITIAPTDSVSVTMPANWLFTTAGPLPAGTYAATNIVGGSFLPPVPGTFRPTMSLGYNVMPDTYFSNTLMFSNMAGRMGTQNDYGHVVALDSDGYPTLITNSATSNIVTQPDPNPNGGGKGTLNAPNGLYAFIFDDVNETTPVIFGNNTSFAEVTQYRNLSGPTNRVVVYNIQANQAVQFAPWINWSWVSSSGPDGNGHYACTMKNLRIYPPDPSDPTGMTPWGVTGGGTLTTPPPKFHPDFVRMVQKSKSLRFMKCLSGADNGLADFADFKQVTHLDRSSTQIAAHDFPILSSTAYTGSTVLDDPIYVLVEVTTATPHGLWTGAKLIGVDIGTVTLSDGQVFDSSNGYGVATVLDATHFVWHAFQETTPGLSMVGTNAGGKFSYGKGTALPIEDCVDLCNLVGADCWLNQPASATVACAQAYGQFVGGLLDPALKVRLEHGNECWDFYNFSYAWLRVVNYATYGAQSKDYTTAYADIQGASHNAFRAGLTAAGWTGTLVRTFSTQGGRTDLTTSILTYAKGKYQVDEVAIAPYYNSLQTGNVIPYLGWSKGLCLDILELDALNTNASFTAGTIGAIEGVGLPTMPAIVGYETGPEALVPGLSLDTSGTASGANFPTPTDLYTIQQDIQRDPRFWAVQFRSLQNLQGQQMTLAHDFYVNGPGQWQAYGTYQSYNQGDGTGTAADAANASTPQQMDGSVLAEAGGANHHWMSLVTAASMPTVTPSTASLAVGATLQLSASNFTGNAVTWSSGSGGTATVTTGGLATGTGTGTTTITATGVANPSQTATCLLTVTPAATIPGVPTLAASPASPTSITLAFSDNSGGTPTGYTLQRSPHGASSWATIATPTTSPYTDAGLSPSTTYDYRISATDPAGTSAYSTVATAQTSPNPSNTGGGVPAVATVDLRRIHAFRRIRPSAI